MSLLLGFTGRELEDVFINGRSAKSVLAPPGDETSRPLVRKRKGWGWFEERKEDVAEKGREVARKWLILPYNTVAGLGLTKFGLHSGFL